MWPMTTISVGPEQLLADDERPDDVVGGEPAGVADDVGVARSAVRVTASTSSRASMQATMARPRSGAAVSDERSNDSA